MMPQNKSFHSLLPGSLLCLLLAGACVSAPQDYASYVDPFIPSSVRAVMDIPIPARWFPTA